MNIIRTAAVELSTIPAIAYKQKLASGGSGIRIYRLDQDAVAVGTIEKRDGTVTPYGQVDAVLFPEEAFEEAVSMTQGLPFSARGKVVVKVYEEKDAEDVAEDEEVEKELPNMINSVEYKAIVERYSDEKGKMNFALMNKDFIQFAAKSKVAVEMAEKNAPAEEILNYIVMNRAAHIAGQKEHLDDPHTDSLIATLDEIETRSAFKELNSHIRKMLAKKK